MGSPGPKVFASCAQGPAPPAQAPAEVGAGRRSQPHAGPQIAAQQQAAQQRHALLQEPVALRGYCRFYNSA